MALLGDQVELDISNVPTLPSHTRGGGGMYTSTTSTSHFCTTGFVAYEGSDRTKLGVLTAAHCPNTAIYKEPDMSRYEIKVPAANRERFNPSMDMQWMTAPSGHAASGQFYADGGSTPRTVTGYRSYAEVNDTGFFGTSKGTFICHYGKTTGQSCGEVYDKTAAPDYGKTSTTNGCALGSTYVACDDAFVEVRNKVVAGETQPACAGGDSGGPWFAYGVAFGIHSGGASRGTAPGQCDKAFFTPIERSTNIGVTIYIP